MLWLSRASIYGTKQHKSSEEDLEPLAVLNNEYFHVVRFPNRFQLWRLTELYQEFDVKNTKIF